MSRLARSVKRSLTRRDKLRLSLHRASNPLIIQKDSFRIISQGKPRIWNKRLNAMNGFIISLFRKKRWALSRRFRR
jgi:hypothetical protein